MRFLSHLQTRINNRHGNGQASWIVGASIGAAAAGMIFYVRLRGRKVRHGRYACQCGKVEAELLVQPASYSILEQPSMMCCCTDCVGASCEKICETSAAQDRYLTPGVHYMLFFHKEIHLRKGAEYLQSFKLSSGTPNRRIYSTCCQTPMAISVDVAGVTHLFAKNIQPAGRTQHDLATTTEEPLVPIPPTLCFFYSENKRPHIKDDDDRLQLDWIPTTVAPWAIFKMVSRLLITAPYFKGTGTGFPDDGSVRIGYKDKEK